MVRNLAIDYYQYLHTQEHDRTRSIGVIPFHASDGWLIRFKGRHGFCRRKPKPVKKRKESMREDDSDKKLDFVAQLEEALNNYSHDVIVNMDETPGHTVEFPNTGWFIEEDQNLEISTWGEEKQRITLIPAVTASGQMLRLAWINNAGTYRAISKMKLPGDIASYFSKSGWINRGIMLSWCKEVLQPYLRGRPGVLIMDAFKAHWKPEILDYLKEINVETICVPEKQTYILQPLDISFMGAFKRKREQIATEIRWNNFTVLDNKEEGVIRAHSAYKQMSKMAIKRGWGIACPTLEHLFKEENEL